MNTASACLSFSASPVYNKTLGINAAMSSVNNITLASGMTLSASVTTNIISTTSTSTLTSNGKTLPCALTFSGAFTKTLGDNWTVTGNVIAGDSGGQTLNGNTLNCNAGFSQPTAGFVAGTTLINMAGTGTLSTGAGEIRNNITINSTGTCTINTLNYGVNTLTDLAGTIAGTPNITVSSSSTFQTSGINWNNFTISAAATITLNSMLNVSATLTDNFKTTFNGTSGFSAGVFKSTTAGAILTFQTGLTYTVTSGITITATAASPITFSSSTANQTAKFNLNIGATQDIGFCSATDIDSSGGQTIFSRKGTLTRTTNWKNLVTPIMISSVF